MYNVAGLPRIKDDPYSETLVNSKLKISYLAMNILKDVTLKNLEAIVAKNKSLLAVLQLLGDFYHSILTF